MAVSNIRSVNYKQAAALLETLTQHHLFNNPNSVFATEKQISAFGKYQIKQIKNGCVVYKHKHQVANLRSFRSALSWCIADKYNITTLKKDISDIDSELSRRETDVLFYQHVIKNSNNYELKNTVFDRISQCQSQIIWLRKRLNKCINSAKYWQQKGFDNETSRLGIQKPNTNITKGF